jgi:acyl-CoA synthetase (AMP-forming)/AMP-acid ligase II
VVGEIYIGGICIARGYVNRAELTKERFIENPFLTIKDREERLNLRLYKTGDLGKYDFTGEVKILGRIDHLVKIRGVRIEIGEIEYHLNQYEPIENYIVIDMKDKTGSKFLSCFSVVKPNSYFFNINSQYTEERIRSHLKQLNPYYMIPRHLIKIEKMPLTENGKTDIKSLEHLFEQSRESDHTMPNTPS